MPSSGGKAFQEFHNAHVNVVLVHVCVCDGVMCDGVLVCGVYVCSDGVLVHVCVYDGVMVMVCLCVWCVCV